MTAVAGSMAGSAFGLVLVAAIIGIPISVALVRNHRHAEATRYSHMAGWVPGNPDIGRVHGLVEAPPSPYGTLGPRIVHEEQTAYGKRVWIVAGEPPPRPEMPTPVQDRGALASVDVTSSAPEQTSVEMSITADDHTPAAAPKSARRKSADPLTPVVPEVRVLGRVEIVGWKNESGPKIIPELACFLALHADRSVPGEEIRAALWPGDLETTEASMKSLHNMISILRTNLGKEYVPAASKGSGYRLAPTVTTDWGRFTELVESAGNGGSDEIAVLTSALELVRGAPFESVTPGSYTWAWTELFVARMEVAIAKAAVRLAEIHIAHGDGDRARWAALQGLSASPYDRNLWRCFLTAAAVVGAGELDRAVRHVTSVLGDDVHEFDGLIASIRTKP